MAFDASTWGRMSASVYDGSVVLFTYSTSDSLATVTTAGYFDNASEVGGDDAILVSTSDSFKLLKTSLSGTTLTASVVDDGNTLADDSIDSQHYVDGSIDAVHLSSNSVTTDKIADGAVTAVKQGTGLYPIYSKLYTTTGGSTSETITVSGLQTTDIVIADMNDHGATPVSCNERRVSAADTIYLQFSADPGNDHKMNIIVFRPLN